MLDLWKAAWDGLIWKALISKAKAAERELNRNSLGFNQGRSQNLSLLDPLSVILYQKYEHCTMDYVQMGVRIIVANERAPHGFTDELKLVRTLMRAKALL